jgi:hypothetical protein
METDYSKIDQNAFERTVRDYAIYKVIGTARSEIHVAEIAEVTE